MPIGRVVELVRRSHPSVTQSSLRFLEREGLLVPTRTAGGHRLYSEEDVQRILRIKDWQAQRLSLDEIRERLRQRDAVLDLEQLTRAFLEQVLAGEVEAAGRTVLEIDDLGMPLHRIFGEVIEPALIAVGRGWQHGTVLVAQEKTVSELVRDLIAELSLRHAPPDPQGPTVVAACMKGERHELGLRMIVGLLRADGFRVRYLGADVDTGFLLDAVRLHPPVAVLLSAPLGLDPEAVEETVAAIHRQRGTSPLPHIVVGGRLAIREPERISALGAIPLDGGGVSVVTHALNHLLATGSPRGA
jgi:DNA-binding transcriptional MerR regulator